MEKEENKLEVIKGDGTGINMSHVENYIVAIQHKKKERKKLIIPEEKKVPKKKNG